MCIRDSINAEYGEQPGNMEGAAGEAATKDGTLVLEESIAEDDSVYDLSCEDEVMKNQPWKTNEKYFKKVRISAVAALKLSVHAHWGACGREVGDSFNGEGEEAQGEKEKKEDEDDDKLKKRFEVMGYLQGKVEGDTFVILDSFPVNAKYNEVAVEIDGRAAAQMIVQGSMSAAVDRTEVVRGWYHTHPDLTLFFSNIDVRNQLQMQQFSEPFIALVCEPVQMLNMKTVRIGAFRCMKAGFSGEAHDDTAFDRESLWSDAPAVFKPVPEADLHGHNDTYYRLPVEIFKSKMDNAIIHKLFSEGWADSLAAPSVLDERLKASQVQDLASRVEKVSTHSSHSGMRGPKSGKKESALGGVSLNARMSAEAQLHDMMTATIKNSLFN
eukprot:TRINITY_DN766_c0_g1_i1.p1 TRINITY_DN766_c0_g1~~TRINITY_DN766_c0_g1_i1.p1  ORF type:complete len:383 (+),score=122.85 TRINITY_DN766_c0_g1_i1:93-1241(+)